MKTQAIEVKNLKRVEGQMNLTAFVNFCSKKIRVIELFFLKLNKVLEFYGAAAGAAIRN